MLCRQRALLSRVGFVRSPGRKAGERAQRVAGWQRGAGLTGRHFPSCRCVSGSKGSICTLQSPEAAGLRPSRRGAAVWLPLVTGQPAALVGTGYAHPQGTQRAQGRELHQPCLRQLCLCSHVSASSACALSTDGHPEAPGPACALHRPRKCRAGGAQPVCHRGEFLARGVGKMSPPSAHSPCFFCGVAEVVTSVSEHPGGCFQSSGQRCVCRAAVSGAVSVDAGLQAAVEARSAQPWAPVFPCC